MAVNYERLDHFINHDAEYRRLLDEFDDLWTRLKGRLGAHPKAELADGFYCRRAALGWAEWEKGDDDEARGWARAGRVAALRMNIEDHVFEKALEAKGQRLAKQLLMDEVRVHVALLRDAQPPFAVFVGGPDAVAAGCRDLCRWHDGTVPGMAWAAHKSRAFGDVLPVMADAIEEAAADMKVDQALWVPLAEHCRRPGHHSRGCWVVRALTYRRA